MRCIDCAEGTEREAGWRTGCGEAAVLMVKGGGHGNNGVVMEATKQANRPDFQSISIA
jgi:hypothetical protein